MPDSLFAGARARRHARRRTGRGSWRATRRTTRRWELWAFAERIGRHVGLRTVALVVLRAPPGVAELHRRAVLVVQVDVGQGLAALVVRVDVRDLAPPVCVVAGRRLVVGPPRAAGQRDENDQRGDQ